jgi:hypothetical protein
MKRFTTLLLVLFFLGIACTFSSGGGTGGKVDQLLADPQVGLDALSDYHAELTVAFTGTANGGSVKSIETYTESKWPALAATFATFEPIDEDGQPSFVLTGDVGAAHYTQDGKNGDCTVRWEPEAEVDGSSQLALASFLIPVAAAQTAGEETVQGISARRYTFDGESLGLPEEAKAGGEVWIAIQGGYVVKYTLQVEGGASYFGEGTQGTQRIEYLLSEVGTRPQVEYPAGCKPVLADVPAMNDATDIIRLPGILDYTSKSPVDAITAFYADYFKTGGWEQVGDNRFADERAVLIFGRGDAEDIALVVVRKEAGAQRVMISVFSEESVAASTPESGPTSDIGSNPVIRVVNGLNILLGMDSSHPAPSSFHMESFHNAPAWEDGAVVHIEDRMTADVQGKNVHFVDRETASDGTISETEVYLIGELQYDMENGLLQPPGVSMKKLAWVMWPLDPITILGTGAGSAESAGTEVLDGRTAEIYDIDSGGDALSGASGVSLNITAVKGRVWIDRETGALLKAELDYLADVMDADGKVMDNADGRLEITVTQVGKVTVELPAQ